MYRGISVGRCQSLVLRRISFYSCAWMIYWETNKNWFNKIIYTHVYYGSKFGKRFYIFIFLIYVWSLLEKLIMNIYITKLNFLRCWMINNESDPKNDLSHQTRPSRAPPSSRGTRRNRASPKAKTTSPVPETRNKRRKTWIKEQT